MPTIIVNHSTESIEITSPAFPETPLPAESNIRFTTFVAIKSLGHSKLEAQTLSNLDATIFIVQQNDVFE